MFFSAAVISSPRAVSHVIPARGVRGRPFLGLGCLSGVGCSILIVDGGRGGEPTPHEEAVSGIPDASSHDASSDFLVVAGRAREARDAADAQALAADPFLTEALDLLD